MNKIFFWGLLSIVLICAITLALSNFLIPEVSYEIETIAPKIICYGGIC